METIKNPVEYTGTQIVNAAHGIASTYRSLQHIQDTIHSPPPIVRRISSADIRDALHQGLEDFGAYRSDVIFSARSMRWSGLCSRASPSGSICCQCSSLLRPASL